MKQNCSNCIHGVFELTDKGNIRRSKPGKCEYKIKWPVLPDCLRERFQEPWRSSIWYDNGTECRCFEPK